MRPVSDSLDSAAREWAAEEHVHAAKTASAVEALQEAEAASSSTTPSATPAAAPVDPELASLCGVLWFVADKAITRAAGSHMALQPDELEKLAAATAPVLNKYLPAGASALLNTPEGALVACALTIYGAKFLAAPSSAAGAEPTPPQGATA